MNRTELQEYIKNNIRLATVKDEFGLDRFSHSKLESFTSCRYRYFLHYEKEILEKGGSIALELGGLFHEIMEERGRVLTGELNLSLEVADVKARWQEKINDVKRRRWEEWEPDKNGVTYDEKINRFWKYYPESISSDAGWKPFACEQEFHFVWKDKLRMYGFIDRIDQNQDGDLRVIDYKTSNTVYSPKIREYSQQMTIYALACMALYDKIPINYEYDFIFLTQKAAALNKKDSLETALKNIEGLYADIMAVKATQNYYPITTPLCHWCPYCETNEAADKETKTLCKYFCRWTRQKKDFATNRPFEKDAFNAETAFEEAEALDKSKLIW